MAFKLVYEKDGKIFASENAIPDTTKDTEIIAREELDSFKLVYETSEAIVGSPDALPGGDDEITIYTKSGKEAEEPKESEQDPEQVTPVAAEEEEDITEEEEEEVVVNDAE